MGKTTPKGFHVPDGNEVLRPDIPAVVELIGSAGSCIGKGIAAQVRTPLPARPANIDRTDIRLPMPSTA